MQLIEVSITGRIAEVRLDRPKVNAMSRGLLTELAEKLEALASDDNVAGVLLTGAGRCFSAGLDLAEVAALDVDGAHSFLATLDRAFLAAFRLPKPVAAAVQGHAIAGGLILPLSADHFVLGRGDYQVGLTELLVGVPFPRVPYEIVRHALDPRAQRRFALNAVLVGPADAFAGGVGDELVDDAEAAARAWLVQAVSRPTGAFRLTKALVRADALARIDASAERERGELVTELLAARDAVLGTLRR